MSEVFIVSKDESYLHIEKWQKLDSRLKVGFTTRIGGCSKPPYDAFNLGLHVPDNHQHVIENRQNLAHKLDVSLAYWVSGEQIHDTNIKVVDKNDRGKGAISYQSSLSKIDGLITQDEGILCTAFFADCVPLYFFDPVSHHIGIAHAGWKGTVQHIASKMVHKLVELGVELPHLRVAIGPCISQEKYEVDDAVISQINKKYQTKSVVFLGENRYLLDLKQLNVEILLQSGVLRNNIEITNYCTFTDYDKFFSHRRDQGKTGRMLGFIGYVSDRDE